ncbi:hypothetical protein PybrP1_003649 [[Pythium] brassicae (nom. inval.)]|nr:hypothetical protein PybrP1_003649 [[Pythium] brassicae (nom. inval.)]
MTRLSGEYPALYWLATDADTLVWLGADADSLAGLGTDADSLVWLGADADSLIWLSGNLVDESLAIGGQRLRDKHRAMRRLASGGGGRPTRLWMCEQGCCSIRWKLDYAEFQSYTFYAQVSPYVVVQDKTGRCECLICRGRSESPSVGVGGSRRGEMNALEMLRKACEARRDLRN